MKTLIVSDSKCDFVDVLESCGAETECIEFQKVLTVNLEDYDSFCILPEESGAYPVSYTHLTLPTKLEV